MVIADRPAEARLSYAKAAVHLGCAFLLADQPDPALDHLHAALDHALPGGFEPHLPLLIQEAERCSALGDHREAIQRWQDIAALLAEATPEFVYHKLSAAYAANRAGFGGSQHDNALWGDCSKHVLLAWLHRWLQPALYLEIGVDQGVSLACATGAAIGVDPRPELKLTATLPPSARIVASSSDAFFAQQTATLLQPAPELAFIDGMHLFEFALRDLLHSESHMAPWGLIAIDDIYPCHPVQASRRRRSGSWTGDVWKLVPILRQHRPISEPPAEVLERHGAIPSSHTLVLELLQMLIQARWEQWLVRQVQVALAGLRPRIAAAEQACCGRVRELSQEPCLLPDPAGA